MEKAKRCRGWVLMVSGLLSAASIFSLSSCAVPDDGYGSLGFSVEVAGNSEKPVAGEGTVLNAIDCATTGIASMEAKAKNSGGTVVASGGPWACELHSGTVTGVPVGTDMSAVLSGKDSSGTVIYQGIKTGITITAGVHTNIGMVTLTPTNSSGGGTTDTGGGTTDTGGGTTDTGGGTTDTGGGTTDTGGGTADTTAPTTTADPAGGTYASAQTVTLTADETATIYYTTDGTTPTTTSTVYSSAIDISATTTLKFFAVDTAGNSEAIESEIYTIDTDAPTVTFKSPADASVAQAVNSTISATFSEAMDSATATTTNFSLDNGVTGTIAFNSDNTIATFTPSANLANDTTYTVSLTGGIKDVAGNALSAISWTFKTVIASPTGVGAVEGNQQNTISWLDVTGATSYNIYWGTTAGVTTATGTAITGATTPYVHTPLTQGTTYYYLVTAENADGESLPSGEISATPYKPQSLPDTGQTASYTTTFGEDHDYLINAPSYTANGDGTVTDNVTGLMWQKCTNGQTNDATCSGTATTYNWYQASGTYDATSNSGSTDICGSLSLGGQTDWRLPNPKELKNIANYGTYNPAIDTTYFPGTISSNYWSSTTGVSGASYAWLVGFGYGGVYYSGKAGGYYVRCVRGGQ